MFRIYLLVLLNLLGVNCYSDHYWVDYYGLIPPNAIPAGTNSSTQCETYIGQGYSHGYGLMVGTVTPGQMDMEMACYGVVKINIMIKILCAPHPEEYQWLPTTPATYRNDVSDEIPIIGGYDRKQTESLGVLHIGRSLEQGRAIIGFTTDFRKGDVMFYYPLNGTERSPTKYEVLVYRGKAIN
ncbi:hypothetical protein JTB14_002328 [Gonioctena quinquepunctata]|nr:hypothetical protein JTB14_002328 [Gonioctena quinquepunctata]